MKRAFTLVELLVVIAIIAVLVAILVPVIGSALEDAQRNSCMGNLKTIGAAYLGYKNDKKYGGFARVHTVDDLVTAGQQDLDTAALLADISHHPMQNVWELIDKGFLPNTAFKCPADGGYTPRTAAVKYGWEFNTEFSYGIQYPYERTATAPGGVVNPADPAASDFPANGIIMADLCPKARDATKEAVVATSDGYLNHNDGFSHLTKAGNVSFHGPDTPGSIVAGNQIYADDTVDAALLPITLDDTVIVPGPLAADN